MPRRTRTTITPTPATESWTPVPLADTTRQRYLNYALSVITARALPDVRDGLKPVQRRILFSMFHNHRLTPDRPPIKSAKVVGSVIGEWHPHGDVAVYDAMARMAQPWTMRAPLVDGHGNFGSIDGDPPAAYRYTEVRLTPIALELLTELHKDTVAFQPNYDGKGEEPVVLPARFPNLLVNGSTGIAVGMATNIPPHNLTEVVQAAIALIEHRDASIADLMKHIKGPDFPTGGEILNSRSTLRAVYETGQGSIQLRGEYRVESSAHGKRAIVITSIPFAVDKAVIVERIGELIAARKVPQLLDIRDESTTDIRIVLELQKDADPDIAMAYLFKHTPLQTNFSVNLTCLIPTSDSTVARPACLNLKQLLEHFIEFRFQTVTRRFTYDLRVLERRIHLLAGFKLIFDALDQALRIIRHSDGKADAAQKLQQRFALDAAQLDAILETPIYKLSRTEIRKLLDELTDKRRQARDLHALLASTPRLWEVVVQELREVAQRFGDKRRSKVGRRAIDATEFDPNAYIVKEDAVVTISTDGWIRRVGVIKDLGKARIREGDALMAILGGTTLDNAVFFTNYGSAYTIRIGDLPPARSGYGDPAQKLFKFKDGERIIAAHTLNAHPPTQHDGDTGSALPLFPQSSTDELSPFPQAIAVSSSGMGVRFGLDAFHTPSTRLGRKFMKLKPGDEVVGVQVLTHPSEALVAVATTRGRVLICRADEIAVLSGPGRGVTVIKLEGDDRVLGLQVLAQPQDQFTVIKDDGSRIAISPRKYQVVGRGGKGHALFKRGALTGIVPPTVHVPVFEATNGKHDGAP